ncbi:MAG: hypothetical protein HZC25_18690 [Rhodospirillales bacterium]|nr:hypothetical protein [Rhodospirillales bacterium]
MAALAGEYKILERVTFQSMRINLKVPKAGVVGSNPAGCAKFSIVLTENIGTGLDPRNATTILLQGGKMGIKGKQQNTNDKHPPIIFCNIGWMKEYRGLTRTDEKLIGGGKYPALNERGGEVCNFFSVRRKVYGHVETIKGQKDRTIDITRLGAKEGDISVSGIDVIWTATNPVTRGRFVVGWYRNATVYKKRILYNNKNVPAPSKFHKSNDIHSYIIEAPSKNSVLLPTKDRKKLPLGRGKNWMGQAQLWYADKPATDVTQFIEKLRKFMNSRHKDAKPASTAIRSTNRNANVVPPKKKLRRGGPGAARGDYLRYVNNYECKIVPKHNALQKRFEKYLASINATKISVTTYPIDVTFDHPEFGPVIGEIKPCDKKNIRFAIRTAMGQLLDYRQNTQGRPRSLIILEAKPKAGLDVSLAHTNGFGLAYPDGKGQFKIDWPQN